MAAYTGEMTLTIGFRGWSNLIARSDGRGEPGVQPTSLLFSVSQSNQAIDGDLRVTG